MGGSENHGAFNGTKIQRLFIYFRKKEKKKKEVDNQGCVCCHFDNALMGWGGLHILV